MTGHRRVSWTINSEVVLLLGWGRAILLQLAHPLVARGVADHSAFRAEALGRWRRLYRTLTAMLSLTFGPEDAAARVIARINGIHDGVHGRLPEAAGDFSAGSAYSARDPALLRWVHVTTVDSFLRAYELYVRALSPDEIEAYCAESAAIAPLIGIPEGYLPRTVGDMASYLGTMLASGEIAVTDTARELARAVVYPPGSHLGWPAVLLMRYSTIGLLPPTVREAYGFRWSTRRERTLRSTAAAIRGVMPLVPPIVRQWPAARAAFRRQRAAAAAGR